MWRYSISNSYWLKKQNDNTHSITKDVILDYEEKMVEKQDKVRMLIIDICNNTNMEVSEVINKDESSLVKKLWYETNSEC